MVRSYALSLPNTVGVHVGGFDQTLALKGSGELEAMLNKKLYEEL